MGSETVLVAIPEAKAFIKRCFTKVGAPDSHAEAMADLLIGADHRGHYSHGMNRLDMYIRDLQSKITVCDTEPKILKETAATAFVDGSNLLGAVIGNFCMDLAIKKAKEVGIGWVVCKGSTHYGYAGHYSNRAVDQGFLGMSCTNTSPFLVPTRAKEAGLGTNPITVGAPAKGGDRFLLDMATTAVAVGKVEIQRRKEEPIPEGWALDKDGKMITDPNVAMEAGRLMPLGGAELTSGYKGYGLAMMVEVFCGILSGSSYGPNVRKWMSTETPANLGQCFMALNPNAFAPGFEDRMSDLNNHFRQMDPAEPGKSVLVPGDPEIAHMKKCNAEGGIQYHINQLKANDALAEKLGIEKMKTVQ